MGWLVRASRAMTEDGSGAERRRLPGSPDGRRARVYLSSEPYKPIIGVAERPLIGFAAFMFILLRF